jgi:Restriction endonuclease
MIYSDIPKDWWDLQNKVAGIFLDCGCEVEVEKEVQTVRGPVDVDVFVIDPLQSPKLTYLCECKQWGKRVPKMVVHAFRTVVQDAGAHVGYFISSSGFQSGAFAAAQSANIHLVDWKGFQALWVGRWKLAKYSTLAPTFDKLFDYYDYFNEPVGNALQAKPERIAEVEHIHKRYKAAAGANSYGRVFLETFPPQLPHSVEHIENNGRVVLREFADYMSLFDYYEALAQDGIKAFEAFVKKYS